MDILQSIYNKVESLDNKLDSMATKLEIHTIKLQDYVQRTESLESHNKTIDHLLSGLKTATRLPGAMLKVLGAGSLVLGILVGLKNLGILAL